MGGDDGTGVAAAVRLGEGVALGEVLDVRDPDSWLSLDLGVRDLGWSQRELLPTRAEVIDGQASWPLKGFAVRRQGRELDDARLAMALCHPDGRVREAAVGKTAERPALLPLVVVRCADWAAPVRERAREVLRAGLDGADATGIAALVLKAGRRDRGEFAVGLLRELLCRAPHERLVPLLTDRDRDVRRFAHRIAVAERRLSPAELARTAACDNDTVVQKLCADVALAGASEADYDEVLVPLLGSRNPWVRSAGVTGLRRAGQAGRAEKFLADRSSLVRACARYVVRQDGVDPLPRYRDWCTRAGEVPPGAPAGLGECGVRADAELLWPLVTHPVSAVRVGAVAGLRALDAVEARLRVLLDDPAPAVAREAATALAPSADRLDTDWLLDRLAPDRPRHTRLAAFRLLDVQGGVIQLRSAVALLNDSDDKLRRWAEQSVQRWQPSTDVPRGDAEVAELLGRCEHLFSTYVMSRREWAAGVRS
ncbi:hypothetical protein [Streptomyces noursei]|uniref:hypothetical protein n=1 Tax=Streptomyces noursei TaxID=1971 RepID=UPI001671AC1C|nr:hypothetical protein [Streptomyces noursei]MCZ1015366.1 hypothetical protein [Streptomyces noursei]GGX16902.1 hypothetical protein GCM10010341_42920 [Streptomyces noursei]